MDAFSLMNTLRAVDANGSRTIKESILEKVIADRFVQEVMKWTLDPFITFGITPPRVEAMGKSSFDINSNQIWALLTGLKTRVISGSEAQDMVLQTMEAQTQAGADLLWRILSKDLRCGITGKTVNKLMPGLLPAFDVQLSHKYEQKRIKTFPVAMEPKLDGLRAICLVKDGTAKFFSRVGNHFAALDTIGQSVSDVVARAHAYLVGCKILSSDMRLWLDILGGDAGPTIALEGEALSGLFAETSGAVRRKSVQASNVQYHFFDAVPFDVMTSSTHKGFNMPHSKRREFVEFLSIFVKEEPMRLVPRRLAHSHDQIDAIFEEYRNTPLASYLAMGDADLERELLLSTTDLITGVKMLEGAIVKVLDAPYQKKRSYGWLKCKAEESEDLRVVGFYEGQGKYEGMLGGLVVIRGEEVFVDIGGGFSDAQRKQLWVECIEDKANNVGGGPTSEPGKVIGRLIEVEFHEVTPDGSLRHPRFKMFRNDKDPLLKAA